MAYTDVNQERNILNEVVVSKFEAFPPLLEIIQKNPQISQTDLRKKSGDSNGKIYHCVKGMKVMRLVENGNGLRITDLGKQFMTAYYSNKELFRNILFNCSVSVPLFSKIYRENPALKDAKALYEIFERELQRDFEKIDPKFLGAVVRRYLQGVHNIKLRVGFRMQPPNRKINDYLEKSSKKNDAEIIETLKNLKKQMNLSDKEFNTLIDSLPEKKRDDIISQVFSKVFG